MLYGDLDSSALRGLLPGRTPAVTELFEAAALPGAYARFLELIGEGQGFLISPRIGDSTISPEGEEEIPRSLDDIFQDIQKLAGPQFPALCLHGKMEAAEREEAMEKFRSGQYKIMVATSIIEVGVDIPNANVILIEGAERFGLAQLHQLRGRVGRGGQKSHCLLLPQKTNPNIQTRLTALTRETDGQTLAELDLKLRGPGEQLGLKQAGWPTMTYARLPQDLPQLTRAHQLAEALWADAAGNAAWQKCLENFDFEALTERLLVTAEEAG
jgi:ATP-dependent DNA helicase RecG